jgi:mono/diheme cytochrome c family protein
MRARGFILMLAITSGCAAGLPHPSAADASQASARWPGTTVAELGRGRELYVRTCAGCHALKSPDAVPAGQWEREVTEMRGRHGVSLSDEEADFIIRYLYSVGSRMRSAERTAHR